MECRRNRSHENPISCFLAGDYRANEQVDIMYTYIERNLTIIQNNL